MRQMDCLDVLKDSFFRTPEEERASRESTINDAERLFMMGLIQTRQAYSRLMENPCGSYVNATNLINANDDIYALAA